jgi:nitrogen fixation NifU-like protein
VSLDELYREVILDHYRNPRHRGSLDDPTAHAEGQNPLCGDEVFLDLIVDEGRIAAVGVKGQGCSISQASASMMADAIAGMTVAEVRELAGRFRAMMDIEDGDAGLDADRPGGTLGDLEALQGVRRFPVRIKCANLPWTTLAEALEADG